jgi:AcrR family transcriptional regulator
MSQAAHAAAETRAGDILDRIAGTFARKGFEGSSMQDLAVAAGMSVGNFYRYFPSKLALIAALVDHCTRDVIASFDAIHRSADPIATMRAVLHAHLFETSDEEAALWLHIDAAAVLHPEIAAVKRDMEASIREAVRSMLTAIPGAAAMPPERIGDMTEFLMTFSSGLFRERAFESGPDFARKVERLTAWTFDMVATELSRAAGRTECPEVVA